MDVPNPTTKQLSVAERKAIVADIARTATGKARRGIGLIRFDEKAPEALREEARKLVPAARRALARAARARKAV